MTRARDMRAARELVSAYAALLPFLPLMAEAVEAERVAPGYGAEAVVFRRLIAAAVQADPDGLSPPAAPTSSPSP